MSVDIETGGSHMPGSDVLHATDPATGVTIVWKSAAVGTSESAARQLAAYLGQHDQVTVIGVGCHPTVLVLTPTHTASFAFDNLVIRQAEASPKVKDLQARISLAKRQRDRRTETMLTKELNKIWGL